MTNPIEGLFVRKILINSSRILSFETISILDDCFFIDLRHFSSILKPNFDAKYAALIILRGSSENVSSGSSGVCITFF